MKTPNPKWRTIQMIAPADAIHGIFLLTEEPWFLSLPIIAWATQERVGKRHITRIVGICANSECGEADEYGNFACYCPIDEIEDQADRFMELAKKRALMYAHRTQTNEFRAAQAKDKEPKP